jgi:hypothetical protein
MILPIDGEPHIFWQISRRTQETRRRISLFWEVTPRKTTPTRGRGVGSLAEFLVPAGE